jgi:hypothetical protein
MVQPLVWREKTPSNIANHGGCLRASAACRIQSAADAMRITEPCPQ